MWAERLRRPALVFRMSWRADRRVTAVIAVLTGAEAVTAAVLATTQRWLIDHAVTGTTAALVTAAGLGAVAFAFSVTSSRIRFTLRSNLEERIDLMISQDVLSSACRIPTVEHLDGPEFLDRLTTLRRGTRSIANSCWTTLDTAAAVVSAALSVFLLAGVHPALVVLPLLVLPTLYSSRRGTRLVRDAHDAAAEGVRHEQELHRLCTDAAAAKEIRIAGNGDRISRMADDRWRAAAGREWRASLAGELVQLAGWVFYAGGFLVALLVLVTQAQRGTASAGDVVLVLSLATGLQWQMVSVIRGVVALTESGHVIEHYRWLRGFADRAGAGGAAVPDTPAGLSLREVTVRYPGTAVDALHRVNLDLPPGARVGVVGVNGAGKSTLVKLITGMHRPTSGAVLVDGRPLTDIDPRAWRERSAGSFQDFVDLQARCVQSIGAGDLPRADDEAAVRDAAGRAGAEPVVDRLPEGLSTQLGRVFAGQELSRGEWQRIALARGMMRRSPAVVVLDEPTAAIDAQAEHDLLERLVTQSTVDGGSVVTLLVSHRLATMAAMDLIVVLDHGRVVETGTHRELLRADGHYATLYRTQADGYGITDRGLPEP